MVTKVPKGVWILGIASLLMDASSEMIHSLLPVFMSTTLGLSMTSIGVIEGVAEATSLIVKVFSGLISDYLGKRKLLVVLGYGLAALTKPLFPGAQTASMVFFARFMDRIGKGIRGAPRDALLSDLSPPEHRGATFGLRQSLDTIGAFLGPLLAIFFMLLFAGNIRLVLWLAVIPAILCVLLLILGVEEPPKKNPTQTKSITRIKDLLSVGPGYWRLIALAGVLSLARFSDAFLILKAQATGLSMTYVPLVMVGMNIVYATVAYPIGVLSDRLDRKTILGLGIIFLSIADCILGYASTLGMVGFGLFFWGLHMAFTQGLMAALIADTTPSELRGTAYGVFSFVSGIGLLIASALAGALWDSYGPQATFLMGAGFTILSLIGISFLSLKKQE